MENKGGTSMSDYIPISEKIEEEYDAFCANPKRDLTRLYELLFIYFKYMASKFMKQTGCVDEDEIEDIASEVLAYVVEDVLYKFKKKEAKFATYCAQIVKHKVWNWKKKRIRVWLDAEGNLEENLTYGESDSNGSPEHRMLELEHQLEIIEMMKKYIKALMDFKQKPYRTVSCGFTMVIFQKYHPNTTELTSPKWAYEELKLNTVEQGAERFLEEMREWMPGVPVMWNDAFLDAMDEKEEDTFVSDIIFGERFKTKDFENWSLRLRDKLKKQLLETEKEICF